MMSLFATFDLGNWISVYLPMIFSFSILFGQFWKLSKINLTLRTISSDLLLFFYSLSRLKISKFTGLFSLTLLLFIFWLNLSSILPYVFSFTSQVSVVLVFSSLIWLMVNIFSLTNNIKGFVSHCVPEGTPSYLIFFLFLIELVSNLIRPLTLMVRLVANILAGHLLMSLLGGLVLSFSPCFMLFVGLNTVEMFVSLIQSYIFATMTILYYAELY